MNIALPNLQKPVMWATAAIATIAVVVLWPEKAQQTVRFVLESFVSVAPTIAIGLFLSAWVNATARSLRLGFRPPAKRSASARSRSRLRTVACSIVEDRTLSRFCVADRRGITNE